MPTTSDTIDRIDAVNPEYQAMCEPWELIDALMGGTAAMKAGGEKWLPREEKEELGPYNVRLERSILFERFGAAVDSLAGRPFAKPVQTNGPDLPERLEAMLDGVDDEGRDLTAFCQHCLEIGLRRGLVHILVDYPAVTASNLAEERALDLRPMMLALDPKDLIGWRYDQAINGKKVLTQIRIAEVGNVPVGEHGVEQRRRVRVINESNWQLYELRKGDQGENWEVVQEGDWTVGKITLVTVYLHKTGFMTGKSPLEGLAWLNLAHWQSMSDHRNNLRFARAGLIFRKGMSKEELQKPVIVGVNQEFGCTSPNADMKIIEHSGAAVAAGENELRHLEDQMDTVAKGPLIVRASGNTTATGQAIDEGKGQCELQSWVHRLEGGVRQAVVFAGQWRSEEVPEAWGVDIYDDFGMLVRADEDLQYLQKARDGGDLDRQTYLEGFKLRGVLPENADIDKIIERIKEEGPDLGMLGREETDLAPNPKMPAEPNLNTPGAGNVNEQRQ